MASAAAPAKPPGRPAPVSNTAQHLRSPPASTLPGAGPGPPASIGPAPEHPRPPRPASLERSPASPAPRMAKPASARPEYDIFSRPRAVRGSGAVRSGRRALIASPTPARARRRLRSPARIGPRLSADRPTMGAGRMASPPASAGSSDQPGPGYPPGRPRPGPQPPRQRQGWPSRPPTYPPGAPRPSWRGYGMASAPDQPASIGPPASKTAQPARTGRPGPQPARQRP